MRHHSRKEVSKVFLAIFKVKRPMLFYHSQTIGSQHLLKPSFLNTDFEEKQDSFFPYVP